MFILGFSSVQFKPFQSNSLTAQQRTDGYSASIYQLVGLGPNFECPAAFRLRRDYRTAHVCDLSSLDSYNFTFVVALYVSLCCCRLYL
jgi:hypothetical protein